MTEIKTVKLDELFLDPNNYRLINEKNYTEVSENELLNEIVQKRTLSMVCGPRNENIQDLLDSFRENGYLPVDQIQVRKIEEKKYLVLEGNRRVSALKILKNEYEIDFIDLENFNVSFFNSIPVVIYEGDSNTIQHLIVMGLKHISGNKKWGEWNEALLIKKLSDSGKNENEICKAVGISKSQYRKCLRAVSLVEQYKESDYGDQFSEKLYPIFREVISYNQIKDWLKWNDKIMKTENSNNTEILFNLISKDIDYENDTPIRIEPAITKREEIRLLSKFIDDDKAVQILIEERNISKAFNLSKAGIKEQIQQPIDDLVNKLSTTVASLSNIQFSDINIERIQKEVFNLQSIIRKQEVKKLANTLNDYFYTKIDTHFSSLKVENYKCFENFKLDNLKRINIFAGDNNVGKSTLLETIFALCYQTNFTGIYEIIRRRAKIADNRINYEWFLKQFPQYCSITGIFDNKNVSITTNLNFEETSDFDSTGYLKSLNIDSRFDFIEQSSLIRFFSNKERETRVDGQKMVCPIIYSSPFFLNEHYRYADFYAKAVQTKSLPEIINFIKKNLVNSLKDIRLIDALQRFNVEDDNFKEGMDLSNYGEGLQRVFFISLLFASAENGIILIDEIENALHVELLDDFVILLEGLAEKFNVQLFITSHSKECINNFAKNIKNISNLSYYSLIKNHESKITSRNFTGAEYKKLIAISNRDLRNEK